MNDLTPRAISTYFKQLSKLLKNRLNSVLSPLSQAAKTEKVQAYGILFLAISLITLKGFSGNENLFSSVVHNYIEETAASVDQASNDSKLADIGDLLSLPSNDSKNNALASTIQENTLQASSPASTDYLDGFKPDQVVQYTVQSGDSISSIAEDFGVSVNTIIWANNIKNPDSLSLGQVLKVLPVTGVIHTVANGDTIATIAKKYGADSGKIMSFNDVQDNKLTVGEEIIVPGGTKPGPVPSVKVTKTKGSSIYVSVGNGQCVAFVQAHGYASLHGNAYEWAKYINTKSATVGGVVVLKGGRYGHVAIITAVKSGSIQIVEQNYYGPYIVDHREISLGTKAIVGFIQ